MGGNDGIGDLHKDRLPILPGCYGTLSRISDNGVPGYTYRITNKHSVTTQVINAYTTNSILRLNYDYTVTGYLGINDFSVPVTTNRIIGYCNWSHPY